ncbi:TolC family protein, partial [Sphingomonas sp. 28-62-20]|uniref:TolC family protein n=1 Tax=Sphingomonas sp. 28-62-20 TaxID=1970433 RepID=UPI0035A89671
LRTALLAAALACPATATFAEPITLDEAIAKAVEAAPSIRANEAAIAAARAGRVQAGVRPNPTVTVEGENFVGSGPYNVFGQAEITGTYSQTIERGGKRDARLAFADRDIGVAEASSRVGRLELVSAVQRAFLDVVIAGYVVEIAETRLGVEIEMQREALRRVRGYKDPLFVETSASARVTQAQLNLAEARARQVAARDGLAAYWGGSGMDIETEGEVMSGIPAARQLAEADVALAQAEAERASAAVTLEQTRVRQDYTLSGGARFLRGTNDVALVAGVTIPLGRFDRNQGNIARAQAEKLRIELTAEAQRLDRLRRLASLGAEADAARARADAIVVEVYPQTTKALRQVREGYARGGFTFRDMQGAADAIIQAQAEWLNAVTRYRDLQTEIDRLTGRFDAAADKGINP